MTKENKELGKKEFKNAHVIVYKEGNKISVMIYQRGNFLQKEEPLYIVNEDMCNWGFGKGYVNSTIRDLEFSEIE